MSDLHLPRASFFLVLTLGFAACRSTPEPKPLVAPALDFTVRHYTGSPLAGPTSFAVDEENAPKVGAEKSPWFVDCRVIFLEDMPVGELEPLATRTRLIAAARGEDPVLTSTLLTAGALVGIGKRADEFIESIEEENFGRFMELGAPAAAIPVGVSAWFKATAEEWIDVPDLGLLKKVVSIYVSREVASDEAPSVVLSVEDLADSSGEDDGKSLQETPAVLATLRRELICLDDRPQLDEETLVLVFPSPFGNATGALVAVLNVVGVADESRDEVLAQCISDLEFEQTKAEVIEKDRAAVRTLGSAFQALDLARYHRSGLLYLASNTGAALVEDLALSSDDVALAAFVRMLKNENSDLENDHTAQTGWELDCQAFRFLANLQIESPPLPPELLGILLRYTGEVGRYPGLVQEIVSNSVDSESLRDMWITENDLFLEDSNPGARVRAYDWLNSIGEGPEGFDPFAEASDRRRALSLAREKRDAELEAGTVGADQ
ncbi:MAG: hypothetical protein ACI87A_001536 [Planctomycetota bacterium]|jgi:hypothetical protein